MGVQIGGLMRPVLLRLPGNVSSEFPVFAIRSAFGLCASSKEHSVVSRLEQGNSWSKSSFKEFGLVKPIIGLSSRSHMMICNCRGQRFDDFIEENMKRVFEETKTNPELEEKRQLESSAWPSESLLKGEANSVDQLHKYTSPSKVAELSDDRGVPSSIKNIKRQYRRKRKLKDEKNNKLLSDSSVNKALSSLFFILRAIQSHAFEIRQVLFDGNDVRGILTMVQKEMHFSFLWLFQQIFACTPQFMISVMVLLANYTAYSVSNSAAMAATPLSSLVVSMPKDARESGENDTCSIPDDEIVRTAHSYRNCTRAVISRGTLAWGFPCDNGNKLEADLGGIVRKCERFSVPLHESPSILASPISPSHCWFGNSPDQVGVLGMINCDATEMKRLRIAETAPTMLNNGRHTGGDYTPALKPGAFLPVDYRNKIRQLAADSEAGDEYMMLQSLYEEATNELERRSGQALHCVNLDQEIIGSLVAPVRTKLEPDHYECFERTDELYQHALSLDCNNPLLLCNYAHFLHVVKHDHDRSEQFFLQAMLADPADAEILNRYAGFLWLARGKLCDADKNYKAAIAADPSNPCYAASYAHFLWSADEG